jgi:hypothetical protein
MLAKSKKKGLPTKKKGKVSHKKAVSKGNMGQ